MFSTSRREFLREFAGSRIDLTEAGDKLGESLASAGLDRAQLARIAGEDGVISGAAELERLWHAVDGLDRDGSRGTLLVSADDGGATPAGALLAELAAEVERQRTRRPAGPPPASGGAGQLGDPAPWLDVARGELGQREVKGATGHNPRVLEYHASTSGRFGSDETPWCSSFVNWAMEQAGQRGTGSARALSWKEYGQPSAGPVEGAIAVIDYGKGKGHVGFVVGRDGDNVVILGGNQKDSVSYKSVPASQICAYRLPPGHQPPDRPLPEMKLGAHATLTYAESR